jgi:hypothetical protein
MHHNLSEVRMILFQDEFVDIQDLVAGQNDDVKLFPAVVGG